MAKLSTAPQARRTGPSQSRAAGARKAPPGRRPVKRQVQSPVVFGFPWTRQNVIGVCIGLAVVIGGYLLMASAITKDVAKNDGIWDQSSAVTWAPIVLAIGYCVIIPYFIFKRPKQTLEAEDGTETAAS